MPYSVTITEAAERDIAGIRDYIQQHTSSARAAAVLEGIYENIASLSDVPERGRRPVELADRGITSFREVVSRPDRIVYQIRGTNVEVLLVADGRRDMRTLLIYRLLQH